MAAPDFTRSRITSFFKLTMKLLRVFLSLILLSCCLSSRADIIVIGNVANGIEKLSKDEVINLYMGKNRRLSSGINAIPLDLAAPNEEKAQFYQLLVHRSLPEINSYWARLTFSGQGSPPLQIASVEEILRMVSSNKGAVAYIDRKYLDKRVKLIYDPALN